MISAVKAGDMLSWKDDIPGADGIAEETGILEASISLVPAGASNGDNVSGVFFARETHNFLNLSLERPLRPRG